MKQSFQHLSISAFQLVRNDRPVWIGTLGTFSTVMLENIHLAVGIVVGLTTIAYLLLKIRKELRTQRGPAGPTEAGPSRNGSVPTEDPGRVRMTISGGDSRGGRRRQ